MKSPLLHCIELLCPVTSQAVWGDCLLYHLHVNTACAEGAVLCLFCACL